MPRIHGVVVTFERAEILSQTLDALARQTRRPDTVTVVDNSVLADVPMATHPLVTRTIRTEENLGPAGGLAVGLAAVMPSSDDDDWILFIDDDDPPLHEELIARLSDYATECLRRHPDVGAVGIAGGRFDLRTGRLRRVPDAELIGDVAVSYIGGNQFPMYRVRALRRIEGPRAELFFGFDDLDLGQQLIASEFLVFGAGAIWAEMRQRLGRMNLRPRAAAAVRRHSDWRRYYATRNLIGVTRQYGTPTAALLATLRYGAMRALLDAVRARSLTAATPAARGAVDAWRGRFGRTLEPS